MKQIFKNYLATFVKHWLQTIGTILFILMMFAVVIGFLAAPLQIYSKITDMNRVNNKYDQILSTDKFNYSSDFINSYVYKNEGAYMQKETVNGQPQGESYEIVEGNKNGQILSPIAKDSLPSKSDTLSASDLDDYRARVLKNAFDDFRDGALTKTGIGFDLYLDGKTNSTLEGEYTKNIDDIMVKLAAKYGGVKGTAVASRALAFVNQVLVANGFNNAAAAAGSMGDNIDYSNIGKTIVGIMRDDMQGTKDKPAVEHKRVSLLAIQIFDTDSMLETMLSSSMSYDFTNYVIQKSFNDINNKNANEANAGPNQYFEMNSENTMFFSQKDSSSLFPTKSVVLKTANAENQFNQIQLVEGRLPEKVDLTKDSKAMPEIVINSNYAKLNNLKIGDTFSLPAGVELNNIIGYQDTNDYKLNNIVNYKIVGIGEKFEDSVPGAHYTHYMENIDTYTNAYVDNSWFDTLKEAKWFYSNKGTSDFFTNIRFANINGSNVPAESVLNINYTDPLATNGVFTSTPFKAYSETKTMKSVNNEKIQVIIFIILGVVVLILAFIFINFTITKELNETRRQIGIFKSFGYKVTELSWVFAFKTFLTIFAGAVLGWVVSIAIQLWSATAYTSSVMFSFDKIYANGTFLAIIFLVIPIVFLLISYFMTLYYLAEPTLSLLSNGAKVKKQKKNHSLILKTLEKHGRGFSYRLQQGFVKDSMGKFIVVQVLFAFASLTFALMLGAQDLMYSVVDQGFSLYTKDADHEYWYTNEDSITINHGENKYDINDWNTYNQRNFKYIGYNGNESIGNVLQDHKDITSDSRYRENYLVGSISNTFDSNKAMAQEMLMPLDYYLVKDGGVKTKDLVSTVDKITAGSRIHDRLHAAAEQDANIPDKLKSNAIVYHDYYLNWILSFRTSIMPNGDDAKKMNIQSVDDIISQLRNPNGDKYDIFALQKYVDAYNDSDKGSNPIKLDMNSIVNAKDIQKIQTEFKDTLFGLTDENKDHQKNNLFLADITKIITLELAENYAEGIYKNQLNGSTASSVYNAISKTNEASIWKDFSPNNKKYWGLQNNPLMDSLINPANEKSEYSFAASDSSSQSGGLSLSKMSQQTISLIMAAAMLGYNSTSIDGMPTITLNQAFFNKDQEALFENISITDVDNTQSQNSSMTLFDYKNGDYGKYEASLTHEGVSDSTYKKLAEEDTKDKDKNAIYVVVPYGLAKYRHLKVGDMLTVSTVTKEKHPINLRIIGINKSATFAVSGGWQIDADYTQFVKHYFKGGEQNGVIGKDGKLDKPMFNAWISNEKMLEGDIDLKDIPGSINSMKYIGKNLAIQMKPGTSIFGSIFDGMVDLSSLLGSPIDTGFRLITNPNISSQSGSSIVWPFNILRAGVNNAISQVNSILIVFIVLVAVMLMIILLVVMNIIIEQATPIILTLKSLGYNQKEINWITMGSYIAGAAVSYIIAYCVSLLVWNVFLIVAANLWHIYVFMHYTWKAPIVTLLVIGAILAIGWYVSDQKVQKIPLTLVTGFN